MTTGIREASGTGYLAHQSGITKRQAKSANDKTNELVTRQHKREGSVRLAGLQVLRKCKLKVRIGRTPAKA